MPSVGALLALDRIAISGMRNIGVLDQRPVGVRV